EVLGLALADGLELGTQLVVGVGLQLEDALAEAVALALALALADALGLADALELGAQLAESATATPPSGPVSTTTATEISRTAAPATRPTSPALCSFPQLTCRGRRKIVTHSSDSQVSTPR